jgi:pilus assembly protein Flp/PilA
VKKFLKLLKDVSGASAAEYALILAIVGAAIALAAFNLGGAIANSMDDTRALIENPGTAPGGGGGSGS